MAKTKKTKAPTKRVLVVFHDTELLARIDAWGTANRRHTRSNAVEALVAMALDSQPKSASA